MEDFFLLGDRFGIRAIRADIPAMFGQLHINEALAGSGLVEMEGVGDTLRFGLDLGELRSRFFQL